MKITGCRVMKAVLVRSESVDGGVCPPNQVVVPLFSVKEYTPGGEAAWMMLTIWVEKSELVTVVVTAFDAAAPPSMAEDSGLTAFIVSVVGEEGTVT